MVAPSSASPSRSRRLHPADRPAPLPVPHDGHPRRMLVAEPHPALRRALVALLCAEPGWTATGASEWPDVVAAVAAEPPEAVLLGRTLQDVELRSAVAWLGSAAPEAVVLVAGLDDDPAYDAAACRIGACGYLTLSGEPEEVVARVAGAIGRARGKPSDG